MMHSCPIRPPVTDMPPCSMTCAEIPVSPAESSSDIRTQRGMRFTHGILSGSERSGITAIPHGMQAAFFNLTFSPEVNISAVIIFPGNDTEPHRLKSSSRYQNQIMIRMRNEHSIICSNGFTNISLRDTVS